MHLKQVLPKCCSFGPRRNVAVLVLVDAVQTQPVVDTQIKCIPQYFYSFEQRPDLTATMVQSRESSIVTLSCIGVSFICWLGDLPSIIWVFDTLPS